MNDELWTLVRSIPKGKCVSYGALGKALTNPVSGYMVGRWMASCPPDLPWWRVVAKDGRLPVWRRDPSLGIDQRRTLEEEGVEFEDERVDMTRFRYELEL
jgi:methylated-DNA-protein-cysteine methyltransferase related protein